MGFKSQVFGGCVALFLIACHSAARADYKLDIDQKLGSVADWTIGYNHNSNGCIAAATYSDQTTFWFGFDGNDGAVYMALTNPNWQSILEGKQYPIKIFAIGSRSWQGAFYGTARESEKGIVSGGLKESFVKDLIRSPGIAVSLGSKIIAKLNLESSPAAFSAMVDCQAKQARNEPAAPKKAGDGKSIVGNGTGFFISSKGYLLTNNHVVKDCSAVEIEQSEHPRQRVVVVATDKTNDLALLKSAIIPTAVAALRTQIRVGESVAVYGFPMADILAPTGNFTVGYISALAGLQNDTSKIQISAPIQPGNSGGPVIDQRGNVVAVIVSTASTPVMANISGTLPQNINFAIKSEIAETFLSANGIIPDGKLEMEKTFQPADLADRAKLTTVKVLCER
jgi:S1-C subfamily serine protease